MRSGWQKAFIASISVFIATFLFAVVAIFTNIFIPDELFYSSSYQTHIGVKYVVSFIKAVDTVDFYATFFSGIASGFTYLIKSLS